MAWNPDDNHMAMMNGARSEFGAATLDAAGTVEVPLMLSKVWAAYAVYKSGPIAAGALICDCTITTGAVTITDSAGAVNAGAIVNYLFLGLP